MLKPLKVLLSFTCYFLVFYIIGKQLSLHLANGFSLLEISSDRPFDSRWECLPKEVSEVEKALNMPYKFWNSGGQSFIFLSEDGNYVLKVFKQRVFKEPWWFDCMPEVFPIKRYMEKKRWKRSDKLQRDFTSYKICFEELNPETGLLYVHLNPTTTLNKKLKLTDLLHISHEVDADHLDFVIQKRGELVYDRITRFMNSGEALKAKETIGAILRLIVYRCQNGYHDRDPNIRTNCGFIGDQPIKIDVGRITKETQMQDPKVYLVELKRIAAPFRAWLAKTHPSLVPSLEEELDRIEHEVE